MSVFVKQAFFSEWHDETEVVMQSVVKEIKNQVSYVAGSYALLMLGRLTKVCPRTAFA